MTEFSTQPPESVYGEASRNYLDNVIRADYGSELQDQDVQFGDRYVVDPSQVATYRNLRQMNEAVNSGEPESPKQQLYLESVQSEMAMRETYSSSISHEAITRAFDGVEADADRAGLLASVAHEIQREVRAEARQAATDGDTVHAAELTQSRNDLNTYVGVKDNESAGQRKSFDRNVRNDWLDDRDRDAGFYDTTYSMQEITAMDRAEAKYLPDMLERIARKRESTATSQAPSAEDIKERKESQQPMSERQIVERMQTSKQHLASMVEYLEDKGISRETMDANMHILSDSRSQGMKARILARKQLPGASADDFLGLVREYGKLQAQAAEPREMLHYHHSDSSSLESILKDGKLLSSEARGKKGSTRADEVLFTRDRYDAQGNQSADGFNPRTPTGVARGAAFIFSERVMDDSRYSGLDEYPGLPEVSLNKLRAVAVETEADKVRTKALFEKHGYDVDVVTRQEWSQGQARRAFAARRDERDDGRTPVEDRHDPERVARARAERRRQVEQGERPRSTRTEYRSR